MSKAEERASEEYPEKFVMYGSYYGNGSEIKIDANAQYRNVYLQGYKQAEKDLELSWEDIKVIEKLLGFDNIIESPKEFYQEVLKRFKNLKK